MKTHFKAERHNQSGQLPDLQAYLSGQSGNELHEYLPKVQDYTDR